MRRIALLVVAFLLLLAAPASAGGPTSVIITSPAEQRAAALYTSELAYGELSSALGANPVADPQAPDLHGTPGSNALNITWLIHDVQVWRVDHVFLTADNGPWVETYQSYEGVKFDQRGVVHRPANPEKLVQILNDELGPPGQSVAHPARTLALPTPAPTPAPPATGIQWTSLLIGVVGGIVLVVFGQTILGAFRRRTPVNPVQ